MKVVKPLVSIGMPVYNGEKYIRRALDSLLVQDYENFELLISDNASTDKTWQICQEYAMRDKRIRLNANSNNLGILANFRIVLEMAHGQYFFWAAVDDFWFPSFISTLIDEFAKNADAGLAMCAVRREYPNGSLKDIIRFDATHNRSKYSNWQLALKLLSPNRKTKLQKYNLYINGIFKYKVINEIFRLEKDILKYRERALLVLVALSHKFIYVDDVQCSKTVQEACELRYPEDQFVKTKKETSYLKYWLMCYCKLIVCITKYSQIPLQRKFFVLFFPYWMCWRFAYKQKKRVEKLFYGNYS